MKTQNQENKNQIAGTGIKTAMISIPGCAAPDTLKALQSNGIMTKYLGLDQSGRLLMEIEYGADQKELIDEITSFMQKSEKFVAELSQILNQIFEKLQAEADKAWDEKIKALKLRWKERAKNKKIKQSHGE